MSEAKLEKTSVQISSSAAQENFIATGEVVKFDGFLKVYLEGTDDDNSDHPGILPEMKKGDVLFMQEMRARQRFTRQPPRYTEASLVKKMEELGIGRPSTYAPTISTIEKREYVVKEARPANKRKIVLMTLKDNDITQQKVEENIDSGKTRLHPTDIGTLVNRFLSNYFQNIIDYNFTAKVEKEFDEISIGNRDWNEMIKDFYGPFHKQIETTQEESGKFKGERLLGVDPESGKNISVKIGRYGAIAQIGDTEAEEKPKFAGLRKDQSLDTITLEEAIKLFDFPRSLGTFEDEEITVAIGRFGPYVKHKNKFYSLKKEDNPQEINQERAIELIEEKRKSEKEKIIKSFPEDEDVLILNGRYGPYLVIKKQNFKIPKNIEPKSLTLEDCYKIADDPDNKPKKRYYRKKK
jgi:DNA topoisomerase I